MSAYESLQRQVGSSLIPKLSLIDPEEYLRDKNAYTAIRTLREIKMRYTSLKNFLEKRKEKTQMKMQELIDATVTVRNVERMQKLMKENKNESKKSREVFIPLEESLFVKGEMDPADTIMLWLGANVMIELKFEKAVALLNTHIERACCLHRQVEEELEHVQQQVEIADANFWSLATHLREKELKETKDNSPKYTS